MHRRKASAAPVVTSRRRVPRNTKNSLRVRAVPVRKQVDKQAQKAVALTALERTMNEISDVLRELRQIRDDARLEMYGAAHHVFPLAEPNHVLRGVLCWCGPRVQRSRDAADIVVHNRAQ